MSFTITSDYEPRGDQPEAIAALTRAVRGGGRHAHGKLT